MQEKKNHCVNVMWNIKRHALEEKGIKLIMFNASSSGIAKFISEKKLEVRYFGLFSLLL